MRLHTAVVKRVSPLARVAVVEAGGLTMVDGAAHVGYNVAAEHGGAADLP